MDRAGDPNTSRRRGSGVNKDIEYVAIRSCSRGAHLILDIRSDRPHTHRRRLQDMQNVVWPIKDGAFRARLHIVQLACPKSTRQALLEQRRLVSLLPRMRFIAFSC